MENSRNYFDQPAAEFRTPRVIPLSAPDKDLLIQTWVCSPDNSMNQKQWFFQVEVHHLKAVEMENSVSRHHFLTLGEAMRFRSHAAGEDKSFMILDGEQSMAEFLNREAPHKTIARIDFGDVPLWDGYTLQEVLNIRS